MGMGNGESVWTCVHADVGDHVSMSIWGQAGYQFVCLYVSFLRVSARGGGSGVGLCEKKVSV